MKRLLAIIFLSGVLSAYGQYSPTGKGWKYTPNQQSDSLSVKTFFKLNQEIIRITSPSNGQILKRDAGVWKNMNATSLAYDSLRWYKTTGMLKLWKDGSVALSDTLDGRYPLISTLLDSISHVRSAIPTGVMLKSQYDPGGTSIGQVVNTSDVQTLLNKTLSSPTITDFSLAQHNHSSAAQGGYVNSDAIVEGTTHLFSPFSVSSGNYYLSTASLGIGNPPAGYKLDVYGASRIQQLTLSTNLTFGGITLTGVSTGSGTNINLATKNYVDDQIITAGGYTNEQAQDAVGGILDAGVLGGVTFTYNDAGNSIYADVKDNSHLHNGSTISGLAVSNFTSPNISNWTNDANYIGSSYGLSGALSGTIASPGIANNAVTLAKIQTIATSSFLGRSSIGAGNVEVLSVPTAQGMLGLGSAAYTAYTDYATSGHTHSGTYEVPLTFSTGLTRTGNTITNNITQYSDALARGSISLTTSGTTGAATYSSSTGVLNIPQYSGGTTYTLPTATSTTLGGVKIGSGITITSGVISVSTNYITTETDPNIYAWAKASTKPSYSYSEVGAAASSHTHSYLPLSGGTLTGSLSGTSASFSSTVTGSNFILSDRRLKTNINNSIKVGDIQLVTYNFKKDLGTRRYGVIAQDVMEKYPEVVYKTDTGYYSVNYVDLLVKMVGDLQSQINELKARLNEK